MKRNLKNVLVVFLLFLTIFSSFCPGAFAGESEISEVNINLPAPRTGEETYAHKEIVLDNKNCRVGTIAWISKFNGVEFFAKSDVFLPQYEYSLMFELRPQNEGDHFAENCVVKVNGETVQYVRDDDGDYVLIEYNFGKPEGEYSLFKIIFQTLKSFFVYIKDSLFGFRLYNFSRVSVN